MVLEFKVNTKNIKFDKKKFTEAMKDKAEVRIRQGMRAFLRKILSKGLPPVLTGEARGSLVPLGRFLRVAVPITPKNPKKNNINKGINQGITPKFVRLKTGIHASFGTKVKHFLINDTIAQSGNFQKSRPWESFKIGTKAFNTSIRKNKNKLKPALKKFVKVQ